jgi:hypothetical protein
LNIGSVTKHHYDQEKENVAVRLQKSCQNDLLSKTSVNNGLQDQTINNNLNQKSDSKNQHQNQSKSSKQDLSFEILSETTKQVKKKEYVKI